MSDAYVQHVPLCELAASLERQLTSCLDATGYRLADQ